MWQLNTEGSIFSLVCAVVAASVFYICAFFFLCWDFEDVGFVEPQFVNALIDVIQGSEGEKNKF